MLKVAGVITDQFFPTVGHCRICGGRNTLEIRSSLFIKCNACHFSGDIIQLLATVNKEDILTTIAMAESTGLLAFDVADSKQVYSDHRERQEQFKHYILDQAQQLKQQIRGGTNAIFWGLNIRYDENVLGKLYPHVCPLMREDFEQFIISVNGKVPKNMQEALKWWGQYTALAITSWSGTDIVGLWLLTRRGAHYLPLTGDFTNSFAFGQVPTLKDKNIIIMDDVATALRATVWSIIETGEPKAFLVPLGLNYDFGYFDSNQIVFWSATENASFYLQALDKAGVKIAYGEQLKVANPMSAYPLDGAFKKFMQVVENCLHSPAECVARVFMKSSESTIRSCLANYQIQPSDYARILSYTAGEDAARLRSIFSFALDKKSCTYNGQVLNETDSGWYVGPKLISSAVLRITEIHPSETKPGEGRAYGFIQFKGRSYQFKESLDIIRKNTSEWLTKFIISVTGNLPIIDRGWRQQLLAVALTFYEPTATSTSHSWGWDNAILRLPQFSVDAAGIHAARTHIEGPPLPCPMPLSVSDWDAFKHAGFCKLFLALEGNLLRTAAGKKGVGIILTNEPVVITRCAKALSMEIKLNPSAEVIEANALKPMVLFTEWYQDRLGEAFAEDFPRHIILSTDSHTAKVSKISSHWLHLQVGDIIDYSVIRSVFSYLPYLLQTPLDSTATDFYRNISQKLLGCMKLPAGNKLQSAALDLDMYSSNRLGAGSRILELIIYGIHRGHITPIVSGEMVAIKIEEFSLSLTDTVVRVPTIKDMTETLKASNFLSDITNDSWIIPKFIWDINLSLCA